MRGCGGARRFHAIHQMSDVTEQVKGGNQSGVDIERVVRTITSIYIRDAEAEDLEPLRMEDRKGGATALTDGNDASSKTDGYIIE